MSVVVAHPGGQHAIRLAESLAVGNQLACFFTGLAYSGNPPSWVPDRIRSAIRSRSSELIPSRCIALSPGTALTYFAVRRFVPGQLSNRWGYDVMERFDAWVARRLSGIDGKAVVGFEFIARDTFRQAKNRGLLCVLDAASVHYSAQLESGNNAADKRLEQRVIARKQEEIELADLIVTLSSRSKATYLEAGVPQSKLHVIHPGVDISLFAPAPGRPPNLKFVYLFVGQISRAKGIDLLLNAFGELKVPNKSLHIIGAGPYLSESMRLADGEVVFHGPLSHFALAKEYHKADVLVLPSRFDGFGMVVTEAMASGLPVIVSSRVGASDLVEPGKNGWVFESGNYRSLADSMRAAWEHRSYIDEMRISARETASRNSWGAYGERVRHFYQILEAGSEHCK